MKKRILAVAAALLSSTSAASAADMDRELGLIVSGVVDKWAGVQMIDDGFNDDTVFVNGGEGRLSLPLGSNLSAQMDAKYEYNSDALKNPPVFGEVYGPRYSFQGAFHLSHRDPSSFLFGAFGAAGVTNIGSLGTGTLTQDNLLVGGEVQFYLDSFTLYGQAGYVEADGGRFFNTLDQGFFARGVVRYFPTSDSRLQVEGTYINMSNREAGEGDTEAFIVKARYDVSLDLPVIGSTPLFLAYRGTFRENCVWALPSSNNLDDHTFMIGTSYSFSGDMLTVDRQGATLDTPDMIACHLSPPA